MTLEEHRARFRELEKHSLLSIDSLYFEYLERVQFEETDPDHIEAIENAIYDLKEELK